MVYLIQEANEPLGFDYRIHFYGPYSADLDAELRYRCSRGDLAMDERDQGHLLSVNDTVEISAISSHAQNVIFNFSSERPAQLELLTTALYVQRALPNSGFEGIIAGVQKIKGQKYSREKIEDAIKELKDKKYF